MADMQTLPAEIENESSEALSIAMNIGNTIRGYRLQKGMSQGDIEKRTGLLRCYLSRVENGHTVPSLETLQKIARALDLQLAEFFAEEIVSKEMSSLHLNEDEIRFLTMGGILAAAPGPGLQVEVKLLLRMINTWELQRRD